MEPLLEEYMVLWKQAQVEKENGGITEDTAKKMKRLQDAIDKLERGVPR